MSTKECAKAERFSAAHVQTEIDLNYLKDGGLAIYQKND